MILNKTYCGHAKEVLETFPDRSVNCCVTSPPYWGLRDYKTPDVYWPAVTYSLFGFEITVPEWSGQFGLEPDPKMFVGHMVYVFREVHRVLKNDGTLWLNLGDSYNNRSIPGGGDPTIEKRNIGDSQYRSNWVDGLKPKDLIGIPWMVAFALREDGWYLRQDIIWAKPNPMPESVTDRCTKSHEYIFLFSKSNKYYFDAEAIKKDSVNPYDDQRRILERQNDQNKNTPDKLRNGIRVRKPAGWQTGKGSHGSFHRNGRAENVEYTEALYIKSNKRSVWNVSTHPFKDAHYATFPPDLIVDCIKAGCPVDGVVLDPFSGAGTTPLVARKLNRNYVAIELNLANIEISEKRLYNELGMFK